MVETSNYRHLELLDSGPASRVRLLNHMSYSDEEAAELINEWNSVADRADCRTLFVDCSRIRILNSALLNHLVLLRRRLKRKEAKLVLCGVNAETREVLGWTKLDRFFEIEEDQFAGTAAGIFIHG